MNCPRDSCFKCLASSWWHYFSVETSGGETKQEEVSLQGWAIEGVLSLFTFGLAHCCGQPWGEEPSSSTDSRCHDDIMSLMSAHVTGPKSPWGKFLNPWAEMSPSSSFISAVHYFRGTRSLAPPHTLKTTISVLQVVTLTTTLIRLLFML